MERTVLKELIEWKNKDNRKPLILNGARQVGKTWILNEFADREYAKKAYIYCRKNELARQVFSQDFDTKRIIRSLCVLSGVDITPNDTLIILDEVQDIPEVIESLKYFYEETPEYHIAAAGSLLGISMHQGVSFPVGKVDEINIYPMSFEEFLLAKGENAAFKVLEAGDFEVMTPLHNRFIDLLREYYYVGGMPEAVKEYVTTGAVNAVRTIQKNILNGYSRDFSKHASYALVPRIKMVWQSIPSQLFKENKKFIYGVLRNGARAKEFELAIQWLADAGLVYRIPRCKKIASPISIYVDPSAFKIYLLDVGLLGAMADVEASNILVKNDAFVEYNGGMTEQFVLQQMKCHAVAPVLYHTSEDSRLEIDFLIQRDGAPIPVEVKAGGNVRANSLSQLLRTTPELSAIRYSMLPYKEQEQMTNIPLYACGALYQKRCLKTE